MRARRLLEPAGDRQQPPVAGLHVAALAALGKPPSPGGGLGIAVPRDGRWLLYTQAREAESDIMLMDAAVPD
jgi:hypothetical protein